jgi:hypothetical protein
MYRFHGELRFEGNDPQQGHCGAVWTPSILFPVLKRFNADT